MATAAIVCRKLKDPNAVLDYVFDWTEWPLANGETITSRTVTVATGLTKDTDYINTDGKSVTVWLSGGTDQTNYAVVCHIVTSAGRQDDRTMLVVVRER